MYGYESIAASQTDQVMGDASAANNAGGQKLHRIVVSVATAATSTCSVKDGGGSSIVITAANTPIGVYPVELNMISQAGPWKVTTGAGVTAIAVGDFKS